MMTFAERRKIEVDRQEERNKRDLFQSLVYIAVLILWALCLAGFVNFAAGGW